MSIEIVCVLDIVITFFVLVFPYSGMITLRNTIKKSNGIWIRSILWGAFVSSGIGVILNGIILSTQCLARYEDHPIYCRNAISFLIACTFINLIAVYVLWNMRDGTSGQGNMVMICKVCLTVNSAMMIMTWILSYSIVFKKR